MNNISRRHHYIPQFYLRKFSAGGERKSPLAVFDMAEKRTFSSTAEGIGLEVDFNTIDIVGHSPDALEKAWNDFEGPCGQALIDIEESASFVGEQADFVLHLMALVWARSPAKRSYADRLRRHTGAIILDQILASQSSWESAMTKAFPTERPNITYEEAKRQRLMPEDIEKTPTERLIASEMKVMLTVLECLRARKWTLLQSEDPRYFFVSGDRPVSLVWQYPDSVPWTTRGQPGFVLSGTDVYFPLNSRMAVLGRFDGDEGRFPAPPPFVAAINTLIVNRSRWVYSPRTDFPFEGKGGEIEFGVAIWM